MKALSDQAQCVLRRFNDGDGEMGRDVYVELPALDGQTIIFNSHKIFPEIDMCFKEFGLTSCGVATRETGVGIYEVLSRSSLLDIFNALPGDMNDKILSQHQIVEACRAFSYLFSPGITPTMFFCKKDENLILDEQNYRENVFSIHVYDRPSADSTGLRIVVFRLLEYHGFGSPGNHPRVFKPYGRTKQI
ncbi:MAG: hypothetical protein WCK37_03475 [Candidatus Falkowbacteria bacterium]